MSEPMVSREDQIERARVDEPPTGPAGAVILAAGIGVLVLGIVTTLSEASSGFADALNWKNSVGPLSGKTIISSLAFFAAWAGLTAYWRRANPALRPIVIATGVLIVLGLVGTFPTFFQIFESD
jgi:hypothetical protein